MLPMVLLLSHLLVYGLLETSKIIWGENMVLYRLYTAVISLKASILTEAARWSVLILCVVNKWCCKHALFKPLRTLLTLKSCCQSLFSFLLTHTLLSRVVYSSYMSVFTESVPFLTDRCLHSPPAGGSPPSATPWEKEKKTSCACPYWTAELWARANPLDTEYYWQGFTAGVRAEQFEVKSWLLCGFEEL